MNRISVFLATPISGFCVEKDYQEYRKSILTLIACLREHSFDVYSEMERIEDKHNYDSPAESVNNDFRRIDEMDIFLLLHPNKTQSSTLIELGYAYAKGKAIIIVGKMEDLPYLVLGLQANNRKTRIINSSELNTKEIINMISDLKLSG